MKTGAVENDFKELLPPGAGYATLRREEPAMLPRERVIATIRREQATFPDGGLLLCTSHFVQDHCTIDELTFAFDLIYDLVRP
jgi:hypothetical protein